MGKVEVSNELESFSIELNENEGSWSISITGYAGEAETVTVPASFAGVPVKAIKDSAFSNNEQLKQVIIPEGITSIESWTFDGCTGLTTIKLPESLVFIGSWAFRACINLTSIKFPESLTSMEFEAFEGCTELRSVRIPKNLSSFSGASFEGCTELTEITVDENNPFYSSLDGVLFDKAMTTLMWYPEGKKGEYTVPDGIIDIRFGAFVNSKELIGISFPQSLLFAGNAEFNGEQLAIITVHEANQVYDSKDGVLFRKKERWLLEYPKGKEGAEYVVPDGTVAISGGAFSKCKQLVTVTLPESLEIIGDYAFAECEGITAITLPLSLRFICERAFKGCAKLKSVMLSRKTKIGHKAFEGFSGQFIYLD